MVPVALNYLTKCIQNKLNNLTFSIHGYEKILLNTFINSLGNSEKIITRIILKDFSVAEVKRKLWYMGLRQSVIYPYSGHLAKDIG